MFRRFSKLVYRKFRLYSLKYIECDDLSLIIRLDKAFIYTRSSKINKKQKLKD